MNNVFGKHLKDWTKYKHKKSYVLDNREINEEREIKQIDTVLDAQSLRGTITEQNECLAKVKRRVALAKQVFQKQTELTRQ